MCALSKVKRGQRGVIKSFHSSLLDSKFLYSLGIMPGDQIEVLASSLFGAPMTLRIGNNKLVAIRKHQANLIEIDLQ